VLLGLLGGNVYSWVICYYWLFVAFDLLSYISDKISVLPLECLSHKPVLFTETTESIQNTYSSYLRVSLQKMACLLFQSSSFALKTKSFWSTSAHEVYLI